MYNNIGLQKPNGLGIRSYIQSNRFFVGPRPVRIEGKGFEEVKALEGLQRTPTKIFSSMTERDKSSSN